MKKSISAALVLTASLYACASHAATIYTFQGSLTQYSSSVPTSLRDTFSSYGVALNQPFTIQISIDSNARGKAVATNGSITYYPTYESFGTLTSQEYYTRGASLVSSPFPAVPASYAKNPSDYYIRNTTYYSYNLDYGYYDGWIKTGAFTIRKSGDYGDTSAFVENWNVGDTLSLTLQYDDGSHNAASYDDFLVSGTLQLTSVPIPAGGWLFVSGMAGLLAAKRRRSA